MKYMAMDFNETYSGGPEPQGDILEGIKGTATVQHLPVLTIAGVSG